MVEKKATPGPWTYVRNPENTRWIIDNAPGRAIAVTAGAEPDNEANARLIAAAPDLFEALVKARDVINALYVTMGIGDEGRAANLAFADTALARARGEAE